MKRLTNPLVWLRRIRHRKGYGVHSPFAFRFLTGVVYEDAAFYAYEHLDSRLSLGERFRIRKSLHLLFRIANWLQPTVVSIIEEENAHVRDYIQAGCRTATILDRQGAGLVDLCVLASPADEVLPHLGERSVLVLTSLEAHRQWFRCLPAVVTFDLYDIGIAFFDPRYNKQHYIVNF